MYKSLSHIQVLITECIDFRMYYSSGTWNRPHNRHAMLLDKYWIKLQIGTMAREELKKVSVFKTYSVYFQGS